MHVRWVGVLLGGLVACAPVGPRASRLPPGSAYPRRYPILTSDELHARELAFRDRNPGKWDLVKLEAAGGFAERLMSSDPAVVGDCAPMGEDEWKRWRAFLVRNADVFGLSPSQADQLVHDGPSRLQLLQRIDGQVHAMIAISKNNHDHGNCARMPGVEITGHLWGVDPIPSAPRTTEAEARKRVSGAEYDVTLTYEDPPQRDCGMVGPPRDCRQGPPLVVKRTKTVRPEDVVVTRGLLLVNAASYPGQVELRYALCALPSLLLNRSGITDALDLPSRAAVGFRPLARSALSPHGKATCQTLVLDAVGGEDLRYADTSRTQFGFCPVADATLCAP